MTLEKLWVFESLQVEKLHAILQSPGPCITLSMPSYHPGEPAQPRAALLKASLREAALELTKRRVLKTAIDSLLDPLEDLANDPAWLSGSHSGCAIFRSPDVLCGFRLTQPCNRSGTVAGCFSIRRLLPELWVPNQFYILGLSKESVSLIRCTGSQAQAVELPAGMPMTLQEALELEPPDHDLENRAASGPSAGARRRIRFGTGSGRETEHAHLADFYKLVDRGIHSLLHELGIPVVLSGVEEDIARYRAVSSYPNLVQGRLHGAPRHSLPDAQTVMQARCLLRSAELQREAKSLAKLRETTASNYVSTDPHTIVHAAFEGRVRELYLRESVESTDVIESRGYRSWGVEDLLNLAAVETTLHGGKAFELPGSLMPDRAAVVAIMRY